MISKEHAKEVLENLVSNEDIQPMLLRTDVEAMEYAISVLSAIEKIRAEIQENLDTCKEFGWEEESRDDVIKAYTEVLEIIDKHIGVKDK